MVTHHVLDSLAVLPHLAATAIALARARRRQRRRPARHSAGDRAARLARRRCSTAITRKARSCSRRRSSSSLANVEVVRRARRGLRVRQRCSTSSSRAPSPISRRSPQSSARHLAPGGRLVAMKGVYPDEEIAQLPGDVRVVATPRSRCRASMRERHLRACMRAAQRSDARSSPSPTRKAASARRRPASTSRRASRR